MLKYLRNQQKNQQKRLERIKVYESKEESELNEDQKSSIREIPRIEFYLGKLTEMMQLMEAEESEHVEKIKNLQEDVDRVKLELQEVQITTENERLVKKILYMILRLYNMPLTEPELATCQSLERQINLDKNGYSTSDVIDRLKKEEHFLTVLYTRYFKDSSMKNSKDKAVVGSSWNISEGKSMFSATTLPQQLKNKKLLIHFAGPHGTDIIHACVESLSELSGKFDFSLHDISIHRAWHDVQVVICLTVSQLDSQLLLDKFDQMAIDWHGQYHIQVLDNAEYQFNSAPYPKRSKYLVTVLTKNRDVNAFDVLSSLTSFISVCLGNKVSIEIMKSLNRDNTAWDIRVSCEKDYYSIRKALFSALKEKGMGIDVAITPLTVYRKQRRLIVFDMDSTLIQQEVIDELAREYGVYEKVQEITHQAMAGKLEFKDSLKNRVEMLKGAPISIIEKVKQRIRLTPGAKELCFLLKRLGFQICVLSGGFEPFIEHLQTILPIDHYFANKFTYEEVDGEQIISGVHGEIVDGNRKADLMKILAQAHHLSLSQVICIGDGSNDIPMLKAAGLGIAFKAKDVVQAEIESKLSGSLLDVMYLMGYDQDEIEELLAQENFHGVHLGHQKSRRPYKSYNKPKNVNEKGKDNLDHKKHSKKAHKKHD
eukprot:NODE_23_length_42016_cov_0.755803.p6 type:complete len:653 gc:universal NODE_23_length_42016_cov_0.755803:32560-34518(+)